MIYRLLPSPVQISRGAECGAKKRYQYRAVLLLGDSDLGLEYGHSFGEVEGFSIRQRPLLF